MEVTGAVSSECSGWKGKTVSAVLKSPGPQGRGPGGKCQGFKVRQGQHYSSMAGR